MSYILRTRHDQEALDLIRALGVRWITVHGVDNTDGKNIARMLESPSARTWVECVGLFGDTLLYRVKTEDTIRPDSSPVSPRVETSQG